MGNFDNYARFCELSLKTHQLKSLSADLKVNSNENFLQKIRNFNIMIQNSISINFGMGFIIEMVYLEFLKNHFVPYLPYKKLSENVLINE